MYGMTEDGRIILPKFPLYITKEGHDDLVRRSQRGEQDAVDAMGAFKFNVLSRQEAKDLGLCS